MLPSLFVRRGSAGVPASVLLLLGAEVAKERSQLQVPVATAEVAKERSQRQVPVATAEVPMERWQRQVPVAPAAALESQVSAGPAAVRQPVPVLQQEELRSPKPWRSVRPLSAEKVRRAAPLPYEQERAEPAEELLRKEERTEPAEKVPQGEERKSPPPFFSALRNN
ncbi:MAG TPA: hypothetical protein VMF88_14335 [Bacteroidota bacterium]|nr:hypothetical protein [Bacteroidota bacterium]